MRRVEVFIEGDGEPEAVGFLRCVPGKGRETLTFQYYQQWIEQKDSFSIDPFLQLGRGIFVPKTGQEIFGALGDSAPDQWGRRLMQRAERRRAEMENRTPRTLFEIDYLLGVSDETRLGALRFKSEGRDTFQAPKDTGVPKMIELGRLLGATERLLRDEETAEDLQTIFAPGSSLGGARPKASVIDQHGHLSLAKFPKETDDYSLETWEEIAFRLASKAGITTPVHQLISIAGKKVLLSRRFDRSNGLRLPFMSAMSLTGAIDGAGGSYLDIVDALGVYGAQAKTDREQLFRRMVFNILISNVDDHLRNHGLLRLGNNGWTLSPAYDLNPVPQDLKPRILSTKIDFDDGTCSVELAREVAEFFGLKNEDACKIISNIAQVTTNWRKVAREVGASEAELKRMASAFEHNDLDKGLALAV